MKLTAPFGAHTLLVLLESRTTVGERPRLLVGSSQNLVTRGVQNTFRRGLRDGELRRRGGW